MYHWLFLSSPALLTSLSYTEYQKSTQGSNPRREGPLSRELAFLADPGEKKISLIPWYHSACGILSIAAHIEWNDVTRVRVLLARLAHYHRTSEKSLDSARKSCPALYPPDHFGDAGGSCHLRWRRPTIVSQETFLSDSVDPSDTTLQSCSHYPIYRPTEKDCGPGQVPLGFSPGCRHTWQFLRLLTLW